MPTKVSMTATFMYLLTFDIWAIRYIFQISTVQTIHQNMIHANDNIIFINRKHYVFTQGSYLHGFLNLGLKGV